MEKQQTYCLSEGINWRIWQHELVLFNPFDNCVHLVSSQWLRYFERLAQEDAFALDDFLDLLIDESLAEQLWQQWLQANIIRPTSTLSSG
ncbi:hypothetical protein [Motilimonas pumila]|uniref:hypothetical protein n=1 Tax=Motilimonas pumila TaxID=2303987 RepID=UPI0013150056|nr:hypothetical protein [Motilimonas pumila]